jgi:hypothetical protein
LHVPSILIFWAVVAGGETVGLLGVVFAVPALAALEVLFDFFRARRGTEDSLASRPLCRQGAFLARTSSAVLTAGEVRMFGAVPQHQYNAPVGDKEHVADILILSSTIGSGHMRASAALGRGVALLDPSGSALSWTFPRGVSRPRAPPPRRVPGALKLWPTAYGRIYRSSGVRRPGSYRHYLERAGVQNLERPRAETGARALIAPHFYGAGVLGAYKEVNRRAFAAVVLTDYVPHPVGVPLNLDLYVVADDAAAEVVARLGVPEERIHPTGIP